MGRPKGSKNKKRNETAEAETQSLEEAKAAGERNVAEMVRKASGPVERGRHTRKLPVQADHAELDLAATSLGRLVEEQASVKEQRREAMAGFRDKLSHIQESMNEVAETVRNRTRLVDVECITYLLPTNEIQVVRADTCEVVESRVATAEELQETLPVNGTPSPLNDSARSVNKGGHGTTCNAGIEITLGGKIVRVVECERRDVHDLHRATWKDDMGAHEIAFPREGMRYSLDDAALEEDFLDEEPILPDSAIPHEVDGRELLGGDEVGAEG